MKWITAATVVATLGLGVLLAPVAQAATEGINSCTDDVQWSIGVGYATATYGANLSAPLAWALPGFPEVRCTSAAAQAALNALLSGPSASASNTVPGSSSVSYTWTSVTIDPCNVATLTGQNASGKLTLNNPLTGGDANIAFGPIAAAGSLWTGTEQDVLQGQADFCAGIGSLYGYTTFTFVNANASAT